MNKPVVLSDLDDTLFQSRRKMEAAPVQTAALNVNQSPHSFMTQRQSMLVEWLLAQAELIPVTGRSLEAFRRVQIPFRSWAITTFGAVILTPRGKPSPQWQAQMLTSLAPYAERLTALQRTVAGKIRARGINALARTISEYDDCPVCLVIKHGDSRRCAELYAFADEIAGDFPAEEFYLHRNGNNITWLPHPVDKGLATRWLLDKLRQERGIFPVVGLGDSFSDHRFMKLCDWFGVPHQSQFASAISRQIIGEPSNA